MSIGELRVTGSRAPETEPVRVMITFDAEAARALDLAAGNCGLDRHEFVCRTVEQAIGHQASVESSSPIV